MNENSLQDVRNAIANENSFVDVRNAMAVRPAAWDSGPIDLAHKLRDLLKPVTDEGTSIDSGAGAGSADLWVTVGGVEYFLTIRRSNNQLRRDAAAGAEDRKET